MNSFFSDFENFDSICLISKSPTYNYIQAQAKRNLIIKLNHWSVYIFSLNEWKASQPASVLSFYFCLITNKVWNELNEHNKTSSEREKKGMFFFELSNFYFIKKIFSFFFHV